MADLKTLVLGRKDVADLDREQELPPELMTVNMGPSHPAMHGTVRIVLTVDGEHIVVLNDNNFGVAAAREFGRNEPNEAILLRVPELLRAR